MRTLVEQTRDEVSKSLRRLAAEAATSRANQSGDKSLHSIGAQGCLWSAVACHRFFSARPVAPQAGGSARPPVRKRSRELESAKSG